MELSKQQLWENLTLPSERTCDNCKNDCHTDFCRGRYNLQKGLFNDEQVVRWSKSIEPMLEDRWEWNGVK